MSRSGKAGFVPGPGGRAISGESARSFAPGCRPCRLPSFWPGASPVRLSNNFRRACPYRRQPDKISLDARAQSFDTGNGFWHLRGSGGASCNFVMYVRFASVMIVMTHSVPKFRIMMVMIKGQGIVSALWKELFCKRHVRAPGLAGQWRMRGLHVGRLD